MKKLFSKTLTSLMVQSHRHGSFTTSTSREIQTISSDTPLIEKKGGSWPLWLFFGVIIYGLGETSKIIQTEMYTSYLKLRRQCLEMESIKLNTAKDLDTLGFQRVVCKGVFDKQRSIYVGPKPRSMAKGSEDGFYVITPLLPISNEPNIMQSPILVNRGWVPLDWEEKSLESIEVDVVVATANESRRANKLRSSQLNPVSKLWYKFNNPMTSEEQASRAMHVEVVGVVRKREVPGMYSLVNYPRSLAWFFLDVPKLAQAMGFDEDTIYVEKTNKDVDESIPYPIPRDVEELILSKNVPLDFHFYTVLWHWGSLACFMK